MATLTDAQQAGYANFINSGNATPIAGATTTPAATAAPNFSTSPQNFSATTAATPITSTAATPTPTATGTTSSPWVDTSVAKTYDAAQLKDPTKWNITPEQTVSGQMDNVLNKDGLIMQQARSQGLQQANSRGLLNSSMAVGAAQDAVIKNALPIATSDANANLGANRLNTESTNSFSVNNFNAKNTAESFNAQQKNNTEQFNLTNQYNQSAASFDSNVQASLKQLDQQFNWDTQTRQIATETMTQAQQMKQEILTKLGKDFDTNTKQKLLSQVDDWVINTTRLASLASTVPDMSTLLTY
ncbi:MAG: hypothetical protein WC009_13930 [Methylotenera sp.]